MCVCVSKTCIYIYTIYIYANRNKYTCIYIYILHTLTTFKHTFFPMLNNLREGFPWPARRFKLPLGPGGLARPPHVKKMLLPYI